MRRPVPAVKPCPRCRETILVAHRTSTTRNYDEVTHEFSHPCGAYLVIVEDGSVSGNPANP